MGNHTNESNWAARERLRRVELWLWWRGWVGRGDLTGMFGISSAQASGDLQRYAELNPGAMIYQTRRKRYEGTAGMRCVMHIPQLEEAVALFWGAGLEAMRPADPAMLHERVALCRPPLRQAPVSVQRRIFLALSQGRRVRVCYASVSGSGGKWREMAPHALAHDGLRWHVRSWCLEHGDYRDFVLTRMRDADWPGEAWEPPQKDEAWDRWVTLEFEPSRELDPEARAAIELDYAMEGGRLRMEVRQALVEYHLAQLRVATEAGARPRHLDLVREPGPVA